MNTDDIVIEQAKNFSTELVKAVRSLAKQEGNNYQPLTDEDLQEILQNSHSFLFVAHHIPTKKIVGMVMLMTYRIPYTKKAYFDDLVVDENFRNRGIATHLMQKIIVKAKEDKAAYLDFTARPRRAESNNLYEKLGFKKRDTNVYRLIFNYGEA